MINGLTILNAIASLLVVIGLILISAWLLRNYREMRAKLVASGKQGILSPAPQTSRLEIIETRMIDLRRKLILIRRDETLHLLLCGEGRDIVIETGISNDSKN